MNSMSLGPIFNQLEEIKNHSKRTDKEKLISEFSKNPIFNKVVYYTLNPFKRYNTTRINYIPNSNPTDLNNIFNYLDELSNKNGATDNDIRILSNISSFDIHTVKVVEKIIRKDLDCGASIKTFKKFIPELPDYEVMRCEKDLDKFLKLCDYDINKFMYSIKFDGVRCSASTNFIYLSRSGLEFPNFNVFDDEINILKNNLQKINQNINIDKVTFDGEVVVEENGQIQFQNLMSQVSRIKELDSSKFVYYIFDIVFHDEEYDDMEFIKRYNILQELINNSNLEKIKLVEHSFLDENIDKENIRDKIKELADEKINEGYEGLVLKHTDKPYENKVSRFWCKVKKMYTVDVTVVGWEYGTKKNKNKLGNLICCFSNGVTFGVGTGFTDEQRIEFMYDTPKIIEIDYQELTADKKPRFPSFKRVREDKLDID